MSESQKTVKLLYFALLREQRGLSQETLSTSAATVSALFSELNEAHGFSLSPDDLRVAVNGNFTSFSHCLVDQDEIVFIPPTAGG